MKGGTQAAMALAVGYMLGRRRKLRRATIIAIATAAGGAGVSGTLLKRGAKVLGSTDALGKVSPQLGELADTVRGDLLTAGRAAATAALSNRVESLTDSLHDRSERLRNPAAAAEGAGAAAEGAGDRVRGGARDAGEETAEPEETPVRRRTATRSRSAATRERSPVSRTSRTGR